jgi:hypothetical protein
MCLVLAGGPARARGGAHGSPRAVLLIEPGDTALEPVASRLFLALREQLQQSKHLEYVELDSLLRGGPESGASRSEASDLFERGRQAYDNLELEEAIDLFGQASRILQAASSDPVDRPLVTGVLTYLGAAQLLAGQERKGLATFRKLLVFNRQAAIDPMVFPPALAAAFERASKEVQALALGWLQIQTTPPGAEVWIDGHLATMSPGRVDKLLSGEHLVRLVRRGYAPFGVQVRIQPDAGESLTQRLSPLAGTGRLDVLLGKLRVAALDKPFPGQVDEMLRWADADRLLYLQVNPSGAKVEIVGFHYDGLASQRLRARKKTFDPAERGFLAQASRFFSALVADSSTLGLADAGQDIDGEGGDPALVDEESSSESGATGAGGDSDGVWTRWWFWTAVAAVVAGGTGLALGLTLGSGGTQNSADVVFRF